MFTMVNNTLTLKQLLESGYDIGLKDYPIWDENHREILNKKIINHYYLREIGQETPALFKHYLNMKMNEIMPYYNELYKTTQYEYNPIFNADYKVTEKRTMQNKQTGKTTGEGTSKTTNNIDSTNESTSNATATNTSESNNSSSSNGKNARIDTPQSQLEVNDIDNLTAASELNLAKQSANEHLQSDATATNEDKTTGKSNQSSVNDSSNNISSNSENKNEGSETYERLLQGNYGVKSTQTMIKEEREIIINIDNMIIADLTNCFMLVW